jgi:phosphatidylglycerophosphate synthase
MTIETGPPSLLSRLSDIMFADYISPQGAIGIKEYKYKATNTSLYYHYVSGPFAAWLVDKTPVWVAPNVLTLIGFFCVLCSYSLVWYWCPTFSEEAPSWVWITVACLLFTYRTLDNMDGKQARKIGCGSPLGLSLDHGCDAVTSCLIPAVGCAFMQTGQTFWTVIFIVSAPIAAFILTWEEFYTGVFNLGSFNGVDEGGIITDLIFLTGGIVGEAKLTAFMRQMVFPEYGLEMRQVWVLGMVALALWSALPAILTVVRTEKWKKAMFNEFNESVESVKRNAQMTSDDDGSPREIQPWSARHYKGKRPRVRDAFGAVLPVILGAGLWICSVYFPFKQTGVLLEHLRTVLWLAVMLFSKLITHLHVAHVCGDPYYQWRKTYLVPVFLITVNSLYSDYISPEGNTIVDEIGLLTVCTALATISWIHMAYSVVTGMCRALDIPFWTVPDRCLKAWYGAKKRSPSSGSARKRRPSTKKKSQ